jgi:hypothetical protein
MDPDLDPGGSKIYGSDGSNSNFYHFDLLNAVNMIIFNI